MVKVVARFYLKSEISAEDFRRTAVPLVAATRQEKGCTQYELALSTQQPNFAVMLEGWESQEDLDRHMKTEHFTTIVPEIGVMCERTETELYTQII